MAARIPSLATIYEGYTNQYTTKDQQIAWVQRMGREVGVPVSTLLRWAARDSDILFDGEDNDQHRPTGKVYWRQAIDALLARYYNNGEDISQAVSYE